MACSGNSTNEPTLPADTAGIREPAGPRLQGLNSDTPGATGNDTAIYIHFPEDSNAVITGGRFKGVKYPITVYIPVKQGEELMATVMPEDSTANLRINQLFMPNGKADGPFGREIKYAVKQKGMYRLILGANMMQGEEWKGKFWLKVVVL